jgi:hypothetical protein
VSPVLASFTLGQDQLTDNDNDGIDDDAIGWRWFVILCALPCLLSVLVGLAHVPGFPRWLVSPTYLNFHAGSVYKAGTSRLWPYCAKLPCTTVKILWVSFGSVYT